MAEPLVIDASVGIKWLLPESGSDRARAILGAADGGRFDLLAPDLYLIEAASALWRHHALRGELDAAEVRTALDGLQATSPELAPSAGLVSDAFELAAAWRHPVYDCMYVALGIRLGCPVVTADTRLISALAAAPVQLLHLAEFDPAG